MPKAKVTGTPVRSHDNAIKASDKALDAMGGKDLVAAVGAADDAVKLGLVANRVDIDNQR